MLKRKENTKLTFCYDDVAVLHLLENYFYLIHQQLVVFQLQFSPLPQTNPKTIKSIKTENLKTNKKKKLTKFASIFGEGKTTGETGDCT